LGPFNTKTLVRAFVPHQGNGPWLLKVPFFTFRAVSFVIVLMIKIPKMPIKKLILMGFDARPEYGAMQALWEINF